MDYSKVLVTGGSGMVGRHLQEILPDAIYIASKDYDLTFPSDVESMYFKYQPKVVIHLAAKVGGIIDNINHPSGYFEENVLMNTNMVSGARMHGVKRFIGILSTCIYPDVVDEYPMTEDMLHNGAPTPTNFSYGYAKRCMAVHIDACNKEHGTQYQYLTPCNLYGEYDKWGENSHFVAALIKKIITTHNNGGEFIKLFGTGKPLRQFMYAEDLAKVIKYVIDNDITDSFNVATPDNLSIKEIARIALGVFKERGETTIKGFAYDTTKPDGQFRKDVSIDRMKSIIPEFEITSLRDGIRRTIDSVLNEQIPI